MIHRDEINSMKAQILGLRMAGVLFGLMSLAQLARLIIRPTVVIEGYALPLWPSVLAFVFLGSLSIWMLKLSRISVQ
jgi:hypothetical protein